jgi:hypothetical protein
MAATKGNGTTDFADSTDEKDFSTQSRQDAKGDKTLCVFVPLRLCVKHPRPICGKIFAEMRDVLL